MRSREEARDCTFVVRTLKMTSKKQNTEVVNMAKRTVEGYHCSFACRPAFHLTYGLFQVLDERVHDRDSQTLATQSQHQSFLRHDAGGYVPYMRYVPPEDSGARSDATPSLP